MTQWRFSAAILVVLASATVEPSAQTPAAPATAETLIERATALRKTGDYRAALPLAEQAAALREKALPADDLKIADALHLQALLYDDLHEYAKAEAPNQRALAIREKLLGPDHPDVALSLYNLAWLAKVK